MAIDSGGNTYIPQPISRQDFTYDFSISNLKLTTPASLAPFAIFKDTAPILPVIVRISDYPTLSKKFEGKVLVVSFSGDKGTAEVSLGATSALENSTAPHRNFSKFCAFSLYDENCTIDPAYHKVTATASEITNTGLTYRHDNFAQKPHSTFIYGYIILDTGEAQYITEHWDDGIKTLGKLVTLDIAGTVTVQAGCDKTLEVCQNKFNNEPNFGGFPYIPERNPATEGVF
jgi:uncharacterized phage protein (TIGR02218 family)